MVRFLRYLQRILTRWIHDSVIRSRAYSFEQERNDAKFRVSSSTHRNVETIIGYNVKYYVLKKIEMDSV